MRRDDMRVATMVRTRGRPVPKFPNVCIRLNGTENAFAIISAVEVAMRRTRTDPREFETYRRAAMAGDYENLLRVTRETVNCP